MERRATPVGIDRTEAAALAYFAVGVASEGSIGGRDVAYRLSFAGSIRDGRLFPVGNSGYSIGTLQTDLGQHPEAARHLVEAYRAWSAAQPPPRPMDADDAASWTALEDLLSRTGREIRREGGRDIAPEAKADLQRFLASDAGVDFVHRRDVAQVGHLLRPDSTEDRPALHAIAGTPLFRNAEPEDRLRLATVFLKLENQSGRALYPALAERIRRGEFDSVAAVTGALDARQDYISSGMRHALAGTEAYLALRRVPVAEPVGEAAARVLAEPLVHPRSLPFDGGCGAITRARYDAVRAVFLQPARSLETLQALERGARDARGEKPVAARPDGSEPTLRIDPELQARVHAMGEALGAAGHPALDRIAASLMRASEVAGLQGVRHLATGGRHLVAWDGDPADPATRWSAVPIDQARLIPVEESLRACARRGDTASVLAAPTPAIDRAPATGPLGPGWDSNPHGLSAGRF